AEDGIRDKLVTGVQTCALPISREGARHGVERLVAMRNQRRDVYLPALDQSQGADISGRPAVGLEPARGADRREQRRLAELELAQDAQVHTRMAVSVQQDGALFPDEPRDGRKRLARAGGLDEQLAPAPVR